MLFFSQRTQKHANISLGNVPDVPNSLKKIWFLLLPAYSLRALNKPSIMPPGHIRKVLKKKSWLSRNMTMTLTVLDSYSGIYVKNIENPVLETRKVMNKTFLSSGTKENE